MGGTGMSPISYSVANVQDTNEIRILAEDPSGNRSGTIGLMLEKEHRLCKITRFSITSEKQDDPELTNGILQFTMDHLSQSGTTDVLYTTTRFITLKQLELTRHAGFKILGIFPNAMGADSEKMNGLAAYFFKDMLEFKRTSTFRLHPDIMPLFSIAQKECSLPDLEPARVQHMDPDLIEPLPLLEVINAPHFVAHRFSKLKERKFIAINFYPFQEPNTLVTDPEQSIEIFIKIIPELGFAAVIGEHVRLGIDPAELYSTVSQILKNHGVHYIEVINDAADTSGIECILRSGFSPTAYFPCLKKHRNSRRDYVIFGKSFDTYCEPEASVEPIFMRYLEAYRKLSPSASRVCN